MEKENYQAYTELKDMRMRGNLTRRKIREYLPAMVVTNLSNLLLVSVDGLVVGNFLGKDALASVNIFYPAMLLTGVMSVITAVGIGTSLSTAIGKHDYDELNKVKCASFRLMFFMAVLTAVIQIPLIIFMIQTYNITPEIRRMVWQYAIGIMLCAPLSLLSTVGVFELQISGKMKILMKLAVMEGLANLLLDLLFVGAMHVGVGGAGYGTACANLLRCSVTLICIRRYTSLYKWKSCSLRPADYTGILSYGVPEAISALINAFQNYFLIRIVLAAFGGDGAVIRGVCTFCFSLSAVISGGILGSMRPLVGFLSGSDMKRPLRLLIRQGSALMIALIGAVMAVIELFPDLFYRLHGVREIPAGGLMSVRIYTLYFFLSGLNGIYRLYFGNRKDLKISSAVTLLGNATLVVYAYVLLWLVPGPWIFLCYLLTELTVFLVSSRRYAWWLRKDEAEENEEGEARVLNMTVSPGEAVEASRSVRQYADDLGVDKRISYRAALCLEEMTAYARSVNGERTPSIQITLSFIGTHKAIFTMIDDGACTHLSENSQVQELTTDNYELVKKVAQEVDYDYILNLNYTRIVL